MIVEALLVNALLLADWSQTRYIASHPGDFHETNPILGKHPSLGKVNGYFLTSMILTNGLAYFLGDNGNYVYLTVGIVEGVAVARNYRIGIGLKW